MLLIEGQSTVRQAVLLTPVGRAAVATVLAEGPGVVDAVSAWFRPTSGRPLAEFPVGRIVYGRWGDAGTVGEELVVCRRGETQIEIHCHGGVAAAESILQGLAGTGFATSDWREWIRSTERDPIAADARIALTEARTERAARVLLDQYQGALRTVLEQVAAACNSGHPDVAFRQLEKLLRYERVGRHLCVPWRVVLAGAPNVGKSSLANALLGFERSIVFNQPGTTRDVLASLTAVDGWPVELADTAGLCDSADDIEAQGVARAREQLASADLVLLVVDASRVQTLGELSPEEAILAASLPDSLLIYNKCDLLSQTAALQRKGLRTSATTGLGIAQLLSEVSARLVPDAPPSGAAVPFTGEHVSELRKAQSLVKLGELNSATATLKALTQHLSK